MDAKEAQAQAEQLLDQILFALQVLETPMIQAVRPVTVSIIASALLAAIEADRTTCGNCTSIAEEVREAKRAQRDRDAKIASNCKAHGDNYHDTAQYRDGYDIAVRDVCDAIRQAGGGDMTDPLVLERDLAGLLNRYSLENGSDTPDYLLAQYLLACLAAYNTVVSAREVWWGRRLRHAPTGEAPACSLKEAALFAGSHGCTTVVAVRHSYPPARRAVAHSL